MHLTRTILVVNSNDGSAGSDTSGQVPDQDNAYKYHTTCKIGDEGTGAGIVI